MLTQINLEMNCVAKPWEPETRHEKQRWELDRHTDMCHLFYTMAHNCHGKSKSLTAKATRSRQKQIIHGKSNSLMAKANSLTAKANELK